MNLNQIEDAIIKLRGRYKKEPVKSNYKIPVDENGKLLHYGLRADDKRWDYNTRSYVVEKTYNDTEIDNFKFIDAFRCTGIVRGYRIMAEAVFEDLDGHKYYMKDDDFKRIIKELKNGWIVGQFQFERYYGQYRIKPIKMLWNEV